MAELQMADCIIELEYVRNCKFLLLTVVLAAPNVYIRWLELLKECS